MHGGINEADVPFLMHMEKRADFVKSNTHGTEKNVGKAFQATGMETRTIQNESDLLWTPKQKELKR